VYARTAEARGAWDARLEALVVDSLVRGEQQESLNSWASALNWSSSPVSVLTGTIDGDDAEPVIDELRAAARRARLDLIAGVQGGRLIVVLGGTDDPLTAAEKLALRTCSRWPCSAAKAAALTISEAASSRHSAPSSAAVAFRPRRSRAKRALSAHPSLGHTTFCAAGRSPSSAALTSPLSPILQLLCKASLVAA